ncbi:hypothetical protein [Rhodococcus sp. MEB064]|uniref:hypothetical protein n=1 Tax=Rhodococcus sp. MEB064 TaxID=1587522 RepID=UPI0005ABC167|nr:hypothetical protein [Rhodococcus sp. MEB064]KIQ11775.1 hypothetical protein RU01_18400 [Rhodococcus sp. MEB064]
MAASDAGLRTLGVRVVDQGFWSLGFFAFTLTAGLALDIPMFAAVSVGTAIGAIAVGAARAWAINAPVIVAGRAGVAPEAAIDLVSSRKGAVAFAGVAAAVTGGWTAADGAIAAAVSIAALCALVVLADVPRQVLVIRGRYRQSAAISVTYAVLGGATGVAVASGTAAGLVVPLWCATLLVLTVMGVILCGRAESGPDPLSNQGTRVSFAWRMTAEALYLGIGSQVSTLILFLVNDDVATAGIRYAYTLVFAPAFVVVQGIQPLVIKHVARVAPEGPKAVVGVGVAWSVGVTAAVLVCGSSGALLLATVSADAGPAVALDYLLPVGIAIVSGQVFEVALLAARMFTEPETAHRIRIASVLLDVGSQAIGVTVGGAMGLVVALVVVGVARTAVSAVVLVATPRWVARHRVADEAAL